MSNFPANSINPEARLRFRAVLMTALSFILGVFPLVIATGAAAASRHSLGTPVLGDMTSTVIIESILVPVFFVRVQSWLEKFNSDGNNG